MKRGAIWFLKAAAAGVIALIALCLLCALYYNVPVHYTNEMGTTEYYWEPNRFYSKGTEGFAWGRTNNEGFNNLLDYREGEKVEILMMGSSHMEGFNVAQDQNAAARLNELFAGEKYTYNIGTAGHTLLYCVKHLDAALTRYQPTEYVILESYGLNFSDGELEALLDGELPDIPSHGGGLVAMLQKLPALRLLYTKYIKGMNDGEQAQSAALPENTDRQERAALFERLAERIAESCAAADVQPILAYNNSVFIDEEGRAYTDAEEWQLETMREACERNGILFLDVTQRFMESCEQDKRLPYGFSNTAPGAGHINSWGHRLFAEEIYRTITERES